MSREIAWCLDSPGFGGSEIDLIRVMEATAAPGDVVIAGRELDPRLGEFFAKRRLPVTQTHAKNAASDATRGLTEAFDVVISNRSRAFVVWAHHPDTQRWLQVALALTNRRFALVERAIPSGSDGLARSRLTAPVKRLVAKTARSVVLNGRSQVEHYRQLFGIRNAKIDVIVGSRPVEHIRKRVLSMRAAPSGTPLERFRGRFIVLCVARLAAGKGHDELIKATALAAQRVPAIELVLVGDGEARERLERLAEKDLPGRVHFVGHQADPIPWLAACDVFAFPSYSEGLPGALIEAMAAGLPCVGTTIPGIVELIVEGKTGLLVSPRSVSELAQAIVRMAESPEFAAEVGHTAFEHVLTNYDEREEFDAWRTLIDQLRRRSRGHPAHP